MNTDELRDQLCTEWLEFGEAGAYFVGFSDEAPAELKADRPLDVGSCFKVVVAAAYCRQVERGLLSWDERLRLDADVRIQDSKELGELPDGYELTVRAAAEAMIRSSDNTATELLQRRLGPAAIHQLAADAGMANSRVPGSLRQYIAYYGGYADGSFPPPLANPEPNLSTARDLARLYRVALAGELFTMPTIAATFKELMHLEDLADGTDWARGVSCYRKGGFLQVPPHYALGLAGALATNDVLIPSAFILNFEQAGETAAETTIQAFQKALGRVLKTIENLLANE